MSVNPHNSTHELGFEVWSTHLIMERNGTCPILMPKNEKQKLPAIRSYCGMLQSAIFIRLFFIPAGANFICGKVDAYLDNGCSEHNRTAPSAL